jgi:G3E family GTPase
MKRKGKFDAIIVETTGLADPAPVAQTFFVDQDIADEARLDAIVTVADAKFLAARLKDAPEAKNQIAFADVVIVNKTDLVTPAEIEEVEARIRGINPYAKIHRAVKCNVPLDAVLGRNAFDLDRILEIEPAFLKADDHDHHHHDHGHHHEHGEDCGPDCGHDHHDHHGHAHHDHHGHDHHEHGEDCGPDCGHDHGGLKTIHDEEIQSISMKIEGDVNPDLFMPWINKIVQDMGPEILRSKGILSFPNEPKRFVFQGVHMILDGDLQREWKADEKRESRIVFIGRRLKQDELRRGFMACAIV